MSYSECEGSIELSAFIVLIALFILIIISTIIVFTNESKENKAHDFAFSLFGFVYLFFSGKALNKRGRAWRPAFIISWLGFFGIIAVSSKLGICG